MAGDVHTYMAYMWALNFLCGLQMKFCLILLSVSHKKGPDFIKFEATD